MPANLENLAVATGLEKISFNSNTKERQRHTMLKLPHNYTHLAASKVILKILQTRLHSTWAVNVQIFKLDLEKAEETEI